MRKSYFLILENDHGPELSRVLNAQFHLLSGELLQRPEPQPEDGLGRLMLAWVFEGHLIPRRLHLKMARTRQDEPSSYSLAIPT